MERLSTQKDVLEPNKKDTPHTVHLNIPLASRKRGCLLYQSYLYWLYKDKKGLYWGHHTPIFSITEIEQSQIPKLTTNQNCVMLSAETQMENKYC